MQVFANRSVFVDFFSLPFFILKHTYIDIKIKTEILDEIDRRCVNIECTVTEMSYHFRL